MLRAVGDAPYEADEARDLRFRLTDQSGREQKLRLEEIPLPARIVLVADALDALTSDRPYRSARPLAAALAELRLHAGMQFCPLVVAAALELLAEQPALAAAA